MVETSLTNNEYKMALGVALDTEDQSLFARVIKIAEFNDLVENLLPHLLGL